MLQQLTLTHFNEVYLVGQGQVRSLQQIHLTHPYVGDLGSQKIIKLSVLYHLFEVIREANDSFILFRLSEHVQHVVKDIPNHCYLLLRALLQRLTLQMTEVICIVRLVLLDLHRVLHRSQILLHIVAHA